MIMSCMPLFIVMGLLADTQNCRLRMSRECRERFHRHWLKKTLVSHPGMRHGTCVVHVPWYMSGSLSRSARENVPGIPGACVNRNFTYLVRGPCQVQCITYIIQVQISDTWHRNWKSREIYIWIKIHLCLGPFYPNPELTLAADEGTITRTACHQCGAP